MLDIRHLKKTYKGGIQALKGIHLSIGKGIFGLLGPNGAGKTTLMRILATLLEPTEGECFFNGVDIIKEKEQVRRWLGYLPQEFGLYPSLTAAELLDYLACLKGIEDRKRRRRLVDEMLERVHLSNYKDQKLNTFSSGMKQRIGIAQALIGVPQLLIIDEPTAGLDPEERIRFQTFLSQLSTDITVLLSTHIVSDIPVLCQRFAIIDQGMIIAEMTPEDALKHISGKVWEGVVARDHAERLRREFKVVSWRVSPNGIRMRLLSEENLAELNFRPVAPALDDAYIWILQTGGRS